MRLDCTNLIKPTPNVIHCVFPFVTILRELAFSSKTRNLNNFKTNQLRQTIDVRLCWDIGWVILSLQG